MKFTKQDAIESLKRELTNNDRKTLRMSAKSLDKLTDTLIGEFADDEIGLPDFCSKAMNILSVFNDNVGKDRSDFIKQWEADHGKTDSKDDPKVQNEDPEVKALKERIAALESAKTESEKRASIAQKRKDFVAKLKEKGVNDDEWISDYLSEVNITPEFDIEQKVDKYVKLYNKNKANVGASVPPENPTGGQNAAVLKSIQDAKKLVQQERAIIESKNNLA